MRQDDEERIEAINDRLVDGVYGEFYGSDIEFLLSKITLLTIAGRMVIDEALDMESMKTPRKKAWLLAMIETFGGTPDNDEAHP